MKPGPATSTLSISGSARSFSAIGVGELARLLAGILGEHHGGVGRHVAMRRVARRLDHDAGVIQTFRYDTVARQRRIGMADPGQDGGEDIGLGCGRLGHGGGLSPDGAGNAIAEVR